MKMSFRKRNQKILAICKQQLRLLSKASVRTIGVYDNQAVPRFLFCKKEGWGASALLDKASEK